MAERIQAQQAVPEDSRGKRVDQVAASVFPDYSRERLKSWMQSGELTLDGETCKPKQKVMGGEQLTIDAELVEEVRWQAQDIDLDVVFEDDQVLVINKPAGLVVHPAAGHADGTLVNALLSHDAGLAALPRAGIVHRLDKDTTGLMVVAKTLVAHNALVEQLQSKTVFREYDAIAVGVMTGGCTIDAPIGRHPTQRKKMAVVETGKPAVTHIRVQQRFTAHTWVRARLETGRTHQIRVHMAHRRYPLVGDATYGGRLKFPKGASEALREVLQGFDRQALHARRLGLDHPASGESISWEVALPDDMQSLIEALCAG